MKIGLPAILATSALVVAISSQPCSAQSVPPPPHASHPATRADEVALWKKIEELAFKIGADASGVRQVIHGDARQTSDQRNRLAVSDGLTATNVQIQVDPSGMSEQVSFDLLGSCISTRTLINRYPGLLVLHIPRHGLRSNAMVGATIGSALAIFIVTPGPSPCVNAVRVQTIAEAKAQHYLR